MRRIFKLILTIGCFILVARFAKSQTGSFTLARMSSDLPYKAAWETPPLAPEERAALREILDQPYTYLGKGAQSFVFASKDGQYVIKFFRHHHLTAPTWLRMLPFDFARRKTAKKDQKVSKDFASYKLAYDRFKDETGLVFLHLNKTTDLHQNLDLVDKLAIHHSLPLDKYEFLVQKRASLVYPTLEKMMKEGKIDEAKEALARLVRLLAHRAEQGIFDKDPDLNTNFGFIGTVPIQIDFGRFKPSEPRVDKNEIIRITDHLHQWLMVRSPELDDYLKSQIARL